MDTERVRAPLRVAFVSQTYHPVVGGTEGQLRRLLPKLQALGVEPFVITRGLPGLPGEDRVDGIRVFRCGSVRHGVLGSAGFFCAALWTLFRHKPDLVQAFSLMTPATIAAIHRASGGAPVVVKILRGGHRGDLDRIRGKALFGLRVRLLRRTLGAVQVISAEIEAELAAMGIPAERLHRIANGVDVEGLVARGDGQALRAALDIAPSAPLFVYVGRLVAEKRLDVLLDAHARLRAHHPDARLLIVGDGPERARVAAAASADPSVVAFGQSEDIASVLAAATAYVQPSSTEGMSNSLLEAMAVGLAIVATDVGAAGELLGRNERGWLVPPNEAGALAAAMRAVLDEGTGERGARAARYVAEHHSLSDTGERLARLYRSLAPPPVLARERTA